MIVRKCLVLVFCAVPAVAQDMDIPLGDVVLTVSGDIETTNRPGAAAFDLAMLEALGSKDITTTTIWTSGVSTFTGVPLVTLLEFLGVERGTLEAMAINNYSVTIPVSDAVEDGPIIAYRRDGAYMSLRDKGPLWIIYPYDQSTAYQSEVIYSRSIWQLDRIAVER